MKRLWFIPMVAVCAVLWATHFAQANMITYTERWTASPFPIKSDTPGSGMVLLPSVLPDVHTGMTRVVAANIATYSSAPDSSPATFTDAAFTLVVHIFDIASGLSGSMAFTGVFNGTLSENNANITGRLTSPRTKIIDLAMSRYTVTLRGFTPPGPPGLPLGSIGAKIQVEHNPEPTSLLLASLGVPFVGLFLWRRRRTRRQQAVAMT